MNFWFASSGPSVLPGAGGWGGWGGRGRGSLAFGSRFMTASGHITVLMADPPTLISSWLCGASDTFLRITSHVELFMELHTHKNVSYLG
jgi:hypothetical protein